MRTLFTTHIQELATNSPEASRPATSRPCARGHERAYRAYRASVAGDRAAFPVANASVNEVSAQEHLP